MLICPNCKSEAADNARFCPICGISLQVSDATPEPILPLQDPEAVCEASAVTYAAPAPQPEAEIPVHTESVPAYEEEPASAYEASAPAYEASAVDDSSAIPAKKVSKANAFVGMGLSIEAIVSAGFGALYTLIYFMSTFALPAFGYFVFLYGGLFGLLSMPFAIAGFILSRKAINGGHNNGCARTGRILGIISTVLSCLILLLALAGLFIGMAGVGDLFNNFSDFSYYL